MNDDRDGLGATVPTRPGGIVPPSVLPGGEVDLFLLDTMSSTASLKIWRVSGPKLLDLPSIGGQQLQHAPTGGQIAYPWTTSTPVPIPASCPSGYYQVRRQAARDRPSHTHLDDVVCWFVVRSVTPGVGTKRLVSVDLLTNQDGRPPRPEHP